jgi:Lar family restriction alleviation protein
MTPRPCPFCGGEAETYRMIEPWWMVYCTRCYAETADYKTEAEAVAAWNRRADEDDGR